MPHVSDARAASLDHDRHDLLLVAALAAGDLSGIDRDHAIDLTRSCADCAELRDDLVALTAASASAPPPVTARPRDFRLTVEDAARLRPAGWRRVLAGLVATPRTVTRPLGAGLATLGIVGLLVANGPALPVASPTTQSSGAGSAPRAVSAEDAAGPTGASAAPAAAAPGAVEVGPDAAASAAASAGSDYSANGSRSPVASRLGDMAAGATPAAPASENDSKAASASPPLTALSGGVGEANRDGTGGASDGSSRPLNVLFGAALVSGLALLIWSRRRGRDPV